MNEVTIRQVSVEELDSLMSWRMEVLGEVFSIPPGTDTAALEQANRDYYLHALPAGEHIACFAEAGGERIGCGGICLQQEMPSPDNPTGHCAYLMNIYVRPAYRKQHTGTAIVLWLVGRARELGIGKIYLETSDMGRKMYRHLHFEKMKDMLKLHLCQQP